MEPTPLFWKHRVLTTGPPENPEENFFIEEKRSQRLLLIKSSLEEARVLGMVAFSLLRWDSASLAELLPGKEKIFLPLGSKAESLPACGRGTPFSWWDLY